MTSANERWAKLEVERHVAIGELPSIESLESYFCQVYEGTEGLEAKIRELNDKHEDAMNQLFLFQLRERKLAEIIADELSNHTSRSCDSEDDRRALAMAIVVRLAKEID